MPNSNQFQRNVFRAYRATGKVHLGKIERDIQEGEYLETDGWTVKFDGQEFGMPQVQGAIADNWLVPADDTSGARYISKPAGVQMHSATPNRDGGRTLLPLEVATEDHHVVGTIAGAPLGAQSKRSQEITQANQQYQLANQWGQQAPDLSGQLGNHQPLQASDPRHSTRLASLDQNSIYETMTGQQALAVAPLTPTKKLSDKPTKLTPTNAHSLAASAMAEAERRAHERQLASRQMAAQRRGQQVGVNSLQPAPQNPQMRGQQVGVNQLYPPQQMAPPPPGPIPAQPTDAEFAEYQEFLAWKRMKAHADAQQRQAHQQQLQQAHIQPMQAPAQPIAPPPQYHAQPQPVIHQPAPTPVYEGAPAPSISAPAPGVPSPANWKGGTEGLHWTKRAEIAAAAYGNDPQALEAIKAVEGKGTIARIEKLLSGEQ